MKAINKFCTCALALLFILSGCTDPITVGEELLVDDLVDVGQLLNLPVETRTVADDPIQTYSLETNLNGTGVGFFGQLEDNTFGRWTQGFYFTPSLPTLSGLPIIPSFVGNTVPGLEIDSIVFIMTVDTTLDFYGPGRTLPIRIDQIADPVLRDQDYFTDLDLPVTDNNISKNAEITASREGQRFFDTTYIRPSVLSDTIRRPQLRFPLSDSFVNDFETNVDSADFVSDTTFREFFAGLRILPTATSNSLIPIRPRLSNQTFSGIYIYYEAASGNDTFYFIRPDLFLPAYERDYSGSAVGALVGATETKDVTAIGGQGSFLTEITLPDLSMLDNKVINRAQLEFPVPDIEGYDEEAYPLPQFTALLYRNSSGELVSIEDRVRLTNGTTAAINLFLGGEFRQNDAGEDVYAVNLTVHLQRMLTDPGNYPNQLYLRAVPRELVPDRALLFGAASTTRPVEFRVTFTELEN